MKIKSIELTNVKGIGNHTFQLDLIPNKPNILVAPNGFGKSSFGIAFDSLRRNKIELDAKNYYNDKPLFQKIKNYPFSEKTVYQWRRKYVRENKRGICPTLTANMGTGGHNVPIIKDKKGIRKLTPKECLRLQGFPENYKLPKNLSDSALYKQIGNSVTVTVVQRIAQKIKRVMDE